MANFDAGMLLIAAFVVIAIFYFLCTCTVTDKKKEKLTPSLDNYYTQNADIQDFKYDEAVCHPSCCAPQWPTNTDGMTPMEIEKCINDAKKNDGDYVMTNYTCGNGPNGIGCPCVTKKAAVFVGNRGGNANRGGVLDPTHIIRTKGISEKSITLNPLEEIEARQSIYENVQLKSNELNRAPNDINNVMAIGQRATVVNLASPNTGTSKTEQLKQLNFGIN